MIDATEMKNHMWNVIGAIHEVHKHMGPGLNEYVYQEALEMELRIQNIPYIRELSFHPKYKGTEMAATYKIDFICKDDIIIELKAVDALNINHKAQLFNYMRLLNAKVGIIVNFSPKYAQIERYLYDSCNKEILTVNGEPLIKTDEIDLLLR